jgi:putative oxidoreductase
MTVLQRCVRTDAAGATVLIRILVGGVFLSEGIQKFIYPDALGTGRFVQIGIPAAHVMAPFVGVVEIVCGTLVVLGLLTRAAAVPLLINISVAIVSTKVPILLAHGFGGFALPKLERYGFLSMLHEARTDFSMWLGLVFLLFVGAGRISVDRLLARRWAVQLPPSHAT